MLYRSILLTKLIANFRTYKGHLINPQFDYFLSLVKSIIKKGIARSYYKIIKSSAKKANYIPNLVFAYKVSNTKNIILILY